MSSGETCRTAGGITAVGKSPGAAWGTVSGGHVALHAHAVPGAASPACVVGHTGVSASAAKLICNLGQLRCSPQRTPK